MLKLICPLCGNKLVDGEKRVYETIEEHVTNVECNEPRPTFVCENKDCLCSKAIYWNENGEYYLRGVSVTEQYSNLKQLKQILGECGLTLFFDKEDKEDAIDEVKVDVNPETRQELDMPNKPLTAEERLSKYDELLALHDLVIKEATVGDAFWMWLERKK